MDSLDYSKKRVKAFLNEVGKLQEIGFPYPHSREALEHIHDFIGAHLLLLETLTERSDPATRRAACVSSTVALIKFLPRLGFILRSTTVRNAFEAYNPVLRLCRSILGKGNKLIMSSEWQYIPHLLERIDELCDYVFIGLPATESANPLLVPLAAHELGHAVWLREVDVANLSHRIKQLVVEEIKRRWTEYTNHFGKIKQEELDTDLVNRQNWMPCRDWALNHAEESFCDFLGVGIFGESYLYAFAYLLAPFPEPRSEKSPSLQRRARDLMYAATEFGFDSQEDYADFFGEPAVPKGVGRKDLFRLSIADFVSSTIVSEILVLAKNILGAAHVVRPSSTKVEAIYKRYRDFMVPATNSESLSNIINAAWKAFHDESLWLKRPKAREERDRILADIVLKNLEVLEVEELTEGLT